MTFKQLTEEFGLQDNTLEIKGLVSASGMREDVFRSIISKMASINAITYQEQVHHSPFQSILCANLEAHTRRGSAACPQ